MLCHTTYEEKAFASILPDLHISFVRIHICLFVSTSQWLHVKFAKTCCLPGRKCERHTNDDDDDDDDDSTGVNAKMDTDRSNIGKRFLSPSSSAAEPPAPRARTEGPTTDIPTPMEAPTRANADADGGGANANLLPPMVDKGKGGGRVYERGREGVCKDT